MNRQNKIVIGLNLDKHLYGVIAAILSAVFLFLPYISLEGEKKSHFAACLDLAGQGTFSKSYIFVYLAVFFAVVSAVMAVVSFFKTTVVLVKIWQSLQAISTVFWGLLMFSTRTICKVAGFSGS